MTTKFEQVWKSFEDEETRREFNLDVDTGLAFQVRLLREKNGWTQQQLADRVGNRQETISQWENPNYGRYTLKTLKSLASAFDVGLMVKFAPFSEVVEWNANLTPGRLAPPSFDEENEAQPNPGTVFYPIGPTIEPTTITLTAAIAPTQGVLFSTLNTQSEEEGVINPQAMETALENARRQRKQFVATTAQPEKEGSHGLAA